MLYADIIVNNNYKKLDCLFTYKIPDLYSTDIEIGDRVIVNFGSSKNIIDGLVYKLFTEEEYLLKKNLDKNIKLKEIQDVLPKEFSLTKLQMFILEKLKSRYAATYLEAFYSVLPVVQKIEYDDIYQICRNFDNFKVGQIYKKKEILKLLSQVKLNKLLKDEMIFFKRKYFIKTKPKTVEYVECIINDKQQIEILKKAKKQYLIMQHMLDVKFQNIKELMNSTGATRSDIKNLINKNFIKLVIENECINYENRILKSKYIMDLELTEEQNKILNDLKLKEYYIALIQGVTGSGKTRVYMELAKRELAKDRQVLILLPEISLTPQVIGVFKENLGEEIAVIHNMIKPNEKVNEYQKIKSNTAKIIIGARSALFAPFINLGLIIIDEVHEDSYLSENVPRYDVRELAYDISKKLKVPLIYGSATPPLKIINLVKSNYIDIYYMNNRIGNANLPDIHIIDIRNSFNKNNLSDELINMMKYTFSKNEQVILFHNKKGYDNLLNCQYCGYIPQCINCEISLKTHNFGKLLMCHYCNYYRKKEEECKNCNKKYDNDSGKGIGIEKYKDNLEILFPNKNFEIVDATNINSNDKLLNVLNNFKDNKIDCLIGTQIISKGLDFPNVTLIGILDADHSIFMNNFNAEERAFQLFAQVSGRAGRAEKKGIVLVQTRNPNMKIFEYLSKNDYDGFVKEQLFVRSILNYPPFSLFYSINITSENIKDAFENSILIYSYLDSIINKYLKGEDIIIFKPIENFYRKIRNKYYYKINIKCNKNLQNKLINILYNLIVVDKYSIIKNNVRAYLNFNQY